MRMLQWFRSRTANATVFFFWNSKHSFIIFLYLFHPMIWGCNRCHHKWLVNGGVENHRHGACLRFSGNTLKDAVCVWSWGWWMWSGWTPIGWRSQCDLWGLGESRRVLSWGKRGKGLSVFFCGIWCCSLASILKSWWVVMHAWRHIDLGCPFGSSFKCRVEFGTNSVSPVVFKKGGFGFGFLVFVGKAAGPADSTSSYLVGAPFCKDRSDRFFFMLVSVLFEGFQ